MRPEMPLIQAVFDVLAGSLCLVCTRALLFGPVTEVLQHPSTEKFWCSPGGIRTSKELYPLASLYAVSLFLQLQRPDRQRRRPAHRLGPAVAFGLASEEERQGALAQR